MEVRRDLDPVGLDYSISPGEWCGLGSSLSDLFGLLPGRTLSVRQFDGVLARRRVSKDAELLVVRHEALSVPDGGGRPLSPCRRSGGVRLEAA